MGKTIQVFEHEYLEIDTGPFSRIHWKALGEYNARNGSKYFTLYPDAIKFNQYVGVIQAGSLTIEILPKADRSANTEESRNRWQGALLAMLRACRYVKMAYPDRADLKLRRQPILEAYLEHFVTEVGRLVRAGLVGRYRSKEGNQNALKGQLLFANQLSRNFVHKERFYTRHTIYDKNHLAHQVLSKALKLVSKIAPTWKIRNEAAILLLDFPEVNSVNATEAIFDRIPNDRKSAPYSEALLIARMLLLNYRPDITGGNNHVLALLFDMNKLWEEYVYRQLLALEPEWDISRQYYVDFWAPDNQDAKRLKPDIVIHNHKCGVVVIDTKWKVMNEDYPTDDDLQQLFAYAHYVNSSNLFLLYPAEMPRKATGAYLKKHVVDESAKPCPKIINCSVLKVPLKWEDGQFSGLGLAIGDLR